MLPDAPPSLPKFLPVPQVARHFHVHEKTVRRWIASGLLGSAKVGGRRLVPVAEVHRLAAVVPVAAGNKEGSD